MRAVVLSMMKAIVLSTCAVLLVGVLLVLMRGYETHIMSASELYSQTKRDSGTEMPLKLPLVNPNQGTIRRRDGRHENHHRTLKDGYSPV